MPSLLDAIIQRESGGNPLAISKDKGARGLGQIRKPALDEYNTRFKTDYTLDDMEDAETNKKVASWYLDTRIPEMLKATKTPVTTENVISSYRLGAGAVSRGKQDKGYVADVLRLWEK